MRKLAVRSEALVLVIESGDRSEFFGVERVYERGDEWCEERATLAWDRLGRTAAQAGNDVNARAAMSNSDFME